MDVEIQAPTSVSIGFWRKILAEDLWSMRGVWRCVQVRGKHCDSVLQRPTRQKCFCRAPWKISLRNSLALEILAMQMFFCPQHIFWEGALRRPQQVKKASEAPFSGQNSVLRAPLTFRDRSGRTERFFRSCLRASPPRTFPSNIFLQAFCFDTFDFPQTELARRCHRAGRNCKRAKSFYYAVSGWGFLQPQKERLIWSW